MVEGFKTPLPQQKKRGRQMIKLYVGETFDKVEFSQLLRDLGVLAYYDESGIILDREALNRIPVGHLPVWVWLNKKDINNPLKTMEVK
jgi:hypothetical protein